MLYESFDGQLVIFDKDGTLVKLRDGNPPHSLDETEYIPGVIAHCVALRQAGATLAVASNQGGVAYSRMSALAAHKLCRDAMIAIGAVYYAVCVTHPHGFKGPVKRESYFRKPNPGMLIYLADALGFNISDCHYVGDRDSDREAALNAGLNYWHAEEFFKGLKHGPQRE